MKKILIANDFLKGGGVENILDKLVRYLLKNGDEVYLMIPSCTERDVHNFFGCNVKVQSALRNLKPMKKYSIGWFVDRGIYVFQKLFYRMKIYIMQYDVAIALKEGLIMQEVAGLYAKKKIAWIHTDYSLMHWTETCFKSFEHERRCMMKYDKVVCVSNAVRVSVIQTIGDPGNLCVKYNPMDYKKIREDSKAECSKTKKNGVLLFVSVGRLAYPKNYSLLLDVCNELSELYSFELWILGDGPEREELQKKIDDFGLTCVKLLGNISNPFPYLKQADMFVSASLVESYGLAVQEALILGVPVIAVKCPAIEEHFDERFGLLSEGTYEKLKEALEEVLSNPEKLLFYRKGIEERYIVDNLFEKRLFEIVELWENK